MGKLIYSFIIPVYRCEKYLDECITSIQRQKLKDNYEIILVDDGSLDESSKRCDYYDKKYQNIHAFHKKNGGASSARNYGIEQAQGKYVLFVDGDDTLEECLITLFEKNELREDAIYIYGMSFDYYVKDNLKRTEVYSYTDEERMEIEQLMKKFDILFQNNSLSSACNKVFSREIITKYQLCFDEKMNLYEDFDFVIRYLKYVKEIFFNKEGLYHYRLQVNNSHLKDRISDLRLLMTNLEKIGHSIEELEISCRKPNTAMNTYKKLYLQLMYLHLLYTSDIDESIQIIWDEIEKRKLLNCIMIKEEIGLNEAVLLKFIIENNKSQLKKWIKKKRLDLKIKKLFRPLVNSIRKEIK